MQVDIKYNDELDINIHGVPKEDFIKIAALHGATIEALGLATKYFSFYIGKVEISLFEEK